MVDYQTLEQLVAKGEQLPKVAELEANGYKGDAVWATNALGEIVMFNPNDESFTFPHMSTDSAQLIAA